MRTRKVYLEKDLAFTAAQQKVIPIHVAVPVSFLEIIIEMTNGSAMTESSIVKPHDEFTKIEVVSGAKVFVNATMEELQAVNFWADKELPYMELTLEDDAVQREVVYVPFGLFPYDPNHYLDPARFQNLQLRLTNAFTAAAVTSWAATGHTITVIAHVMDEGAADYQGILTSKSIYDWTAVDGAIETIDLPNDFPYRLIQIQSLMSGADITLNIEKVKLTCDADGFIPVEIDFDHLVMANIRQFGLAEQRLLKRITGAGDVYCDLYKNVYATAAGILASQFAAVITIAGEKVSVEENKIATS